MMKCEDSLSFVNVWENGKETRESLGEFKTHLDGCGDCSRRFGALLPLMMRDADIPGIITTAAPTDFTDTVMAALGKKNNRLFMFNPFLAVAAAVIFVIGLSFGIFFTRLNGNTITVHFTLDAPQASSVYLAGDFNDWSGESYKLSRVNASSPWEISVKLQKGKAYVYNFIVNGTTWIADPNAPARIDDGFGGSGSLLRL